MKCPKCGYNSFECNDICSKCSNDLTGFKASHGIVPIVLPASTRASMAETFLAQTEQPEAAPEAATPHNDMFTFDIPHDEPAPAASPATSNDPFSFQPPAANEGFGEFSFDDFQNSKQAKAEEDAFASLLESSASTAPKPAAPKPQPAAAATSNEFDLDNFSWDDTPASLPETPIKADDDFTSLFGDNSDPAKK